MCNRNKEGSESLFCELKLRYQNITLYQDTMVVLTSINGIKFSKKVQTDYRRGQGFTLVESNLNGDCYVSYQSDLSASPPLFLMSTQIEDLRLSDVNSLLAATGDIGIIVKVLEDFPVNLFRLLPVAQDPGFRNLNEVLVLHYETGNCRVEVEVDDDTGLIKRITKSIGATIWQFEISSRDLSRVQSL